MNDQINAAREVTKTNTATTDTFKSPELGMLGYVVGNQAHFYRASTRKHTRRHRIRRVATSIALPAVDIAYTYANVGPTAVNAFVAAGVKGLMHAGVGDGSLPTKVRPALSAAREKGVIIVRSSRVGQGIVARNGEANDDELDFVVSDTLESAESAHLADAGADQDQQHEGDPADVLHVLSGCQSRNSKSRP